jgi:hypothetical protein
MASASIPQPLVLAPPRDDGLLYAVYVDGEEILHFVQNNSPQLSHLSKAKHNKVPQKVKKLFGGITFSVFVIAHASGCG